MIHGCTNSRANNYNPFATDDNGTCQIPGCRDTDGDKDVDEDDRSRPQFDHEATYPGGNCPPLFRGCTDSLASNFRSIAIEDNPRDPCTYTGCMDSDAFNFDSHASLPGECKAVIRGCTDPSAENFHPDANTDDGGCIFGGCLDSRHPDYNPSATHEDGRCVLHRGCTDPTALNYHLAYNYNDGSCRYLGCTDPTSWNYLPSANVDDGSCHRPVGPPLTLPPSLPLPPELPPPPGISGVCDGQICCLALEARCLACKECVSIAAFCSGHPSVLGCPSSVRLAPPTPTAFSPSLAAPLPPPLGAASPSTPQPAIAQAMGTPQGSTQVAVIVAPVAGSLLLLLLAAVGFRMRGARLGCAPTLRRPRRPRRPGTTATAHPPAALPFGASATHDCELGRSSCLISGTTAPIVLGGLSPTELSSQERAAIERQVYARQLHGRQAQGRQGVGRESVTPTTEGLAAAGHMQAGVERHEPSHGSSCLASLLGASASSSSAPPPSGGRRSASFTTSARRPFAFARRRSASLSTALLRRRTAVHPNPGRTSALPSLQPLVMRLPVEQSSTQDDAYVDGSSGAYQPPSVPLAPAALAATPPALPHERPNPS